MPTRRGPALRNTAANGRGPIHQKHLGRSHGHANDRSGRLIYRAGLCEFHTAVGFLGGRRQVFDNLVALSGTQPGAQILDVGCGTGYFSRRAARAVTPGGHVVGIDPSRPVIDYANRLAPSPGMPPARPMTWCSVMPTACCRSGMRR